MTKGHNPRSLKNLKRVDRRDGEGRARTRPPWEVKDAARASSRIPPARRSCSRPDTSAQAAPLRAGDVLPLRLRQSRRKP